MKNKLILNYCRYHKFFLVVVVLFLALNQGFGQIIVVSKKSNYYNNTIQSAINSANNGDTILVYPGTYYENIDFQGKSITVASLYLLTNEDSCIYNTIIDGIQAGSCVNLSNNDSIARLIGFTIQNGIGTIQFLSTRMGGGIYCRDSYSEISHCNITNNHVNGHGAGIYIHNSQLHLSGVRIHDNHAYEYGGAILMGFESSVTFDTIDRCNIYLNNASKACEVFVSYNCSPVYLAVDTFTVLNPDNYHLIKTDEHGFPMEGLTYDIQNQKIIPVNADLYVSPYGNDTNSGINTSEPLRSVSFALKKIISDSTLPNTIYIKNGLYSPSISGEKYPLNLRSYISFEGESKDYTILDADSMIYLIKGNNLIKNFGFKRMTLTGGNGITNTYKRIGLIFLYVNENVLFENVSMTNSIGDGRSVFAFSTHNCKLINVDIFNNYGGAPHMGIGARYIGSNEQTQDTNYMINCRIYNNHPANNPEHGHGDGLFIDGAFAYPNSHTMYIIGCEFIENQEDAPTDFAVNALFVAENPTVYLVNSTIGNNVCLISDEGYAIGLAASAKLNIYNSIIYGNIDHQIYLNSYPDEPCTLNVYNSLIEGGLEDIYIFPQVHTIYYDSTNIDTDPLWDTISNFPYSLQASSPCIDAGTLNLPDGIELPEYDLAGNPRIYGSSIDIGAYEWFPVGIEELLSFINDNLIITPNPASSTLSIMYNTENEERPEEILIMNAYGIFIEKIGVTEKQNHHTIDISSFTPGFYIAILRNERKIIAKGKFIIAR